MVGRLLQTETDLRAAFFSFSGYYVSPDCDKQMNRACELAFRVFWIFKKIISHLKIPLALHMLARSASSTKVSSPVFAIEKP
jgi:hypothetical protein